MSILHVSKLLFIIFSICIINVYSKEENIVKNQNRRLYSSIYHKGRRIPVLSDLKVPYLTEDPYAKFRNKEIPGTRPRVSGNDYSNIDFNEECCNKKANGLDVSCDCNRRKTVEDNGNDKKYTYEDYVEHVPDTREEVDEEVIKEGRENVLFSGNHNLDDARVYFPVPRNGESEPNNEPCGGVPQGKVNVIFEKASQVSFVWEVINPENSGFCQVLISPGLDKNFSILFPLDGAVEWDGSFPCGRERGFETRDFALPMNWECEHCIVQWKWIADRTSQYSCSDVEIWGKSLAKCKGKCENGGSCFNGKCICPSSFSGEFCEDSPSILGKIFLIIILLLLFGGAGAGAFIFLKKKKEGEQQSSFLVNEFPQNPVNEMENNMGEQTMENNTNNQHMMNMQQMPQQQPPQQPPQQIPPQQMPPQQMPPQQPPQEMPPQQPPQQQEMMYVSNMMPVQELATSANTTGGKLIEYMGEDGQMKSGYIVEGYEGGIPGTERIVDDHGNPIY